MTAGRVRVGTSGWHYPHWRGPFYPRDLPPARWLEWYADRFDTVEINNSFYRTPDPETCAAWASQVPAAFRFAVKANRAITHRRKLKDAGALLADFLDRIAPLGRRRGPLLFQLPPRWRCNTARLADFLAAVPKGLPCAFEFRDPDWHRDEVYRLLERHGAAFCIFDLGGTLSPLAVTAPLVYVRLHGPDGPYAGSYATPTLRAWARRAAAWARAGHEVWIFFDNDERGHAARNALTLRRLLEAA